jgi:nitrate/TMAO reductase-like tetraheme cytochrome c subunit
MVLGATVISGQTEKPAVPSDDYEKPDFCKACHKARYNEWKGTMHAYSNNDAFYSGTFVLASKETNGAVDHFCSRCHTPIGELAGEVPPVDHSKLSDVAKEGVQCDFCHTLKGHEGLGNAQYIVQPGEVKLGPFPDGDAMAHKVAFSEFHTTPEFCGTCHNVDHPVNGLHLETTYTEWKESPYNADDPATRTTCQDCHMTPGPGVTKPNPGKASEIAKERPHIWTHDMVGGGGVAALVGEAETMQTAEAMLKSAVTMALQLPDEVSKGAKAQVKVSLTNVGAGHYVPTGVTELRDMWLELEVTDAAGKAVFASGQLDEKSEIAPGAVKYQVVMADANGNATPKFWLAASKLSDHRLPPKQTVTETFDIPLPADTSGPLKVRARLRYRAASPSVLRLGLGEDSMDVLPIVEMAEAGGELKVG